MKQWKYFLEHELPSVKWLLAISEMASRYQRNAFSLSKKFLAKDLEKYKTYCIFAKETIFIKFYQTMKKFLMIAVMAMSALTMSAQGKMAVGANINLGIFSNSHTSSTIPTVTVGVHGTSTSTQLTSSPLLRSSS